MRPGSVVLRMMNLSACLCGHVSCVHPRVRIRNGKVVPQGLVLGEDLPLGVIANDAGIDKAANVELLRTERCGHSVLGM